MCNKLYYIVHWREQLNHCSRGWVKPAGSVWLLPPVGSRVVSPSGAAGGAAAAAAAAAHHSA